MSWFPIGPDFVFTPRDGNFKRLSRRNEYGRQGLVSNIAIDPTDPATIYVVERPSSGGTSAFRLRNEGGIESASWVPIVDSLQQTDPLIDPSCIAINPVHPEIIYMGTGSRGIYISNTQGNSWGSSNPISGYVRQLIVDPRTASNPATTVLYATTNTGVYRSSDGGITWTSVLSGDVWSLAAYIPNTGTSQFYAGVRQTGVYYATDPTGTWTNLNNQGIGLPAYTPASGATPENFYTLLVDFCPRNPNRVYAWFAEPNQTVGLYTTSSPLTSWTKVTATSPPNPAYGFYNFAMAVAPNSPGDGVNDILFFASTGLFRSADGGKTWNGDAIGFHADQHSFTFFPTSPPAGVIPAFYVGCDGGIAVSSKFADPSFLIDVAVTDFDQGLTYTDSGVYQNYNHGKQSSAVYQYGSHPAISAISYIGCQDTGIGAGTGALGWRGIADSDAGAITAATGADGVKVWGSLGAFDIWPGFRIWMWTDKGEFIPAWVQTTLGVGGSLLAGTSNYIVGLDNKCLAGVVARDSDRTLSNAITATGVQMATPATLTNIVNGTVLTIDTGPDRALSTAVTTTGVQTVTPTNMSNIVPGSILIIDLYQIQQETVTVIATTATTFTTTFTKTHAAGASIRVNANEETVTVTAVTATTFTANFTKTHVTGVNIQLQRSFVARIDQNGIASQISQEFLNGVQVLIVTNSPVDANILYCAATDQKLWLTTSGSTASSSTVWTEVTGNKPSALAISSIALDSDGNVYVLLRDSVTTTEGGGEFPTTITSPLFKIAGGAWVHQNCSGLPTGFSFGKLLADPVQSNTLYASNGARVYKLALSDVTWNWQDISDSLPGQWLYDLWIGNINQSGTAKVLLRAAIPTRGIWERDVTAGATDAAINLYVRDHFLDQGWLVPSPDGLPNPYDPANPGATVYHYQCADIKIDARQPGTASVSAFYQTDPEGSTLPITHVLFDQLNDNSQNLPGSDQALVHVQVHNRSHTPANTVRVWAIYCNASAGVPGLNVSPSTGNSFNFWSQFTTIGQIIPTLPTDSPWKSVGPPQTLSGIEAATPKVASWNWTIPSLPSGNPGHYCMVVFIHSATSPINETSFNVDEMTPRNQQVGQKNLHIGLPLPPSPSPGGGGAGTGTLRSFPRMQEYVEFHNPTAVPREINLVFDLRGLPPDIQTSFQLTRLDTVNPLPNSVSGVDHIRQPNPIDKIIAGFKLLFIFIGWLLQWLGCWLENLGRWLVGLPLKACAWKPAGELPDFDPTVYEASPTSLVEVRGIRLSAFGFGAALLTLRNGGTLDQGSEYVFQVQQHLNRQVVGGSMYIVRIAGDRKLRAPMIIPSLDTRLDSDELERIEREAESFKYVPPWAKEIVEAREEEQGKKL